MSYTVNCNGTWITYVPLEGIDPSFTNSTLWVGAAAFAIAKAQGKNEAEAHWAAESAMFQAQAVAMV